MRLLANDVDAGRYWWVDRTVPAPSPLAWQPDAAPSFHRLQCPEQEMTFPWTGRPVWEDLSQNAPELLCARSYGSAGQKEPFELIETPLVKVGVRRHGFVFSGTSSEGVSRRPTRMASTTCVSSGVFSTRRRPLFRSTR